MYTELLINGPTTVAAAGHRQGFSTSTAYRHTNVLSKLGVAEDDKTNKDDASLWCADPVSGTWTDESRIEIGPVTVAVYGAIDVNEGLKTYTSRYGKAALIPAVTETVKYLTGEMTRRGVADNLDIDAIEAIAVTQVIEGVIAVVKDQDPSLSDATFKTDVHERAIEQAPYQRVDV